MTPIPKALKSVWVKEGFKLRDMARARLLWFGYDSDLVAIGQAIKLKGEIAIKQFLLDCGCIGRELKRDK